MKIGILTTAMCAATSAAFAFPWSDYGAGQTVTLSNTTEVLDADLGVVTNLTGIVIEGETTDLIFANATIPATLNTCYIKGDGRIVKRGAADLVFGEPTLNSTEMISATTSCIDYFTTGGLLLETGVTYFNQTSTRLFHYGPLVINEGATLFTSPLKDCGVESLNGAGNITNTSPRVRYNYTPVVSTKFDNGCNIKVGRYGSQKYSMFTGRIDGFIGLGVYSELHLTNPNSTFFGDISMDVPYYSSTSTKSGQLHINGFGTKDKGSSSSGAGDYYLYGMDFAMNYGGKIFYHGEGGETTDRRIRFGMTYSYGAGCDTIDAGHKGGVTFTGQWSNYTSDGMNNVILTGSNTTDMVLANSLHCYYGSDSTSKTAALWALTKRGTGSWRLADRTGSADYITTWFVEEGTLKYESIADIGEDCALGLSTECFKFNLRAKPATARAESNRLPYEIELGSATAVPTFEFSGTANCTNANRRLGLVGSGAKISTSSDTASVALFGGAFPAEAGAKTLYLGGTGAAVSSIGNLSNGVDSVLSVEKVDANEWKIERDLRLTGDVKVSAGTLTIAPAHEPKNYKWYRLTITKIGKKHGYDEETGLENMEDCSPSDYYVRIRGIALYTADGAIYTPTMEDLIPWENMDDEQKSGGKNYKYPTGYWKNLQPGQITIGDNKCTEYRTYPNNTPKNLFSNLTKASHTVYNTYLACTPGPNNKNAWLPIVFRLPDDAPAIAYYDILADHISPTYNHVATWQMEGSEDGENWTKLHEITECAHTRQDCWASTGTNAVKWALNANCLTEKRGYTLSQSKDPEPTKYATDLSTAASVSVARGATLQRLEGSYAVTLPTKLTVDCAGTGTATVKGFAIPATGTLTLQNAPKGSFALPATFTDCTDLANLAHWTVQNAAGTTLTAELSVSDDGTVTVKRDGLQIFVK